MQLFKSSNINFIGNRNIAFIISGLLFTITIVSVVMHKGLNASIDFVGGTVVQLKFEKPIEQDLGTIRSIISELNFGTPEVKTIGREGAEIQIIVEKQAEGTLVGDEIKNALNKK